MTQQVTTEQMGESAQRRGRGPTKPFPAITFEDAIFLPTSIMEHGVNGEIQRLTLLSKLNISPNSSKTRELIASSFKYGLTTGSYNAPSLKVTDDSRILLGSNSSHREVKEKQFALAIGQFDHFNNVYEKLKNQRLPDEVVLMDEFERVGVSGGDRRKAASLFAANIRYIGILEHITGSEYVRTIDHVLGELPKGTGDIRSESVGVDLPVEGNGEIAVETKRPALHIDIQVHIDPTSSAEQIDHIFASMAKHFYGHES